MKLHLRFISILFMSFLVVIFTSYIISKLENINKLALNSKNLAVESVYRNVQVDFKTDSQTIYNFFKNDTREKKTISLEFGENEYWHLIKIRNLRSVLSEYVYLFDNPMLDEIDIYEIKAGIPTLVKRLGDNRINKKREMALPSIAVSLQKQQQKELLIRTYSLGTPHLPVALFESNGFNRYKNMLYLLWGSIVGIVFVMTAYNLILFLGVHDKLYILYVGYIISFLMVLSFVHGFGIYLLPISFYQHIGNNIISVYYLLGIFLLLFSYYFLHFNNKEQLVIQRSVKGLTIILFVFGVYATTQSEYEAAKPFFLMQLFIYILCLIMLFQRIRKNKSWGTLYIISWLPLFVGSAVGTLLLQGQLEYGFWTRHAAFFGVVFEMTLISMALAERLRVNKAEILYEATHDKIFKLANIAKLEFCINQTPKLAKNKYSVILIELDEVDNFTTIDKNQEQIAFINSFVSDIQRYFSSYLHVIDVDNDSTIRKVCLVREGLFAITITSSDEALLKTTIKEFCKLQKLNNSTTAQLYKMHFVIGAATKESNDFSLTDIVNQAQQAINIANSKKLDFWIFNELDKFNQNRRVEIATELQKAIDNKELIIYHQPKLGVDKLEVIGSEILVRWEHSELGEISPSEFVPIAKDTGLISSLTEWVIDTSCQNLSKLIKEFDPNYHVAINISVSDLHLSQFLAMVQKSLDTYRIAAKHLTFEFTDLKFENLDNNIKKTIIGLKRKGYRISVDALKTPLSNLGFVFNGLVSEIKLDCREIQNIEATQGNTTVIRQLVSLTNTNGIDVVGIGIDSLDSENMMLELPCNIVQGFKYCEPLPFHMYINWLNTNAR
ncbi:EAL domain-containing protein [Psychrosphaera sp. B3R10]|nr:MULTISPECIES: EAL domain-containing protein [unclassified Psychrosphaera]MBU2882244.1 EAL domain-containing protein [Psychrosphaera sp. I2R16]MBU2988925.1 EAL domain-containing protein [Psychrosphaera sp. B3R10]